MARKPRVPKKYRIAGLTEEQQKWLWDYEQQTMLEPLNMEELATGEMSFNEVARGNIDHFEIWMNDAFNSITNNTPFDEEGEQEE